MKNAAALAASLLIASGAAGEAKAATNAHPHRSPEAPTLVAGETQKLVGQLTQQTVQQIKTGNKVPAYRGIFSESEVSGKPDVVVENPILIKQTEATKNLPSFYDQDPSGKGANYVGIGYFVPDEGGNLGNYNLVVLPYNKKSMYFQPDGSQNPNAKANDIIMVEFNQADYGLVIEPLVNGQPLVDPATNSSKLVGIQIKH